MPCPRFSCCVPVMSIRKLLSLLSCGSVILTFGFYLVTRRYNTADELKRLEDEEANLKLSKLDMDRIQDHRREVVKRICDFLGQAPNYSEIKPELFDHIMVNDQHQLLYCYVPKVACTNWKRVMLVLSGTADSPDIPANMSHKEGLIRTLNFYSAEEIEFRLKNYLKFIFVRHPFERVLSAYRNKFQQNYSIYFQNRFGRKIIKRFRPQASPESLEKGHDVSFKEFIHYLVDPQTLDEGPLNEHWRPQYQLCHPCLVQYNVIGKYDSLARDAKYVLDSAYVSNIVSFPTQPPKTKTSAVLEDYFKTIPDSYLFKLFQMYALDFAMFEYKYVDFDKYLPR